MNQLVGLPTLGALIVYQCPNSFAHICVEDLVMEKGEQFALNWAPDIFSKTPKVVVQEYHYKMKDGVMHMLPPNFEQEYLSEPCEPWYAPAGLIPIDKSGSMGQHGVVTKDCYSEHHLADGDILVKNAMSCGICGAIGHKMKWGGFQCSKHAGHCADGNVGIWSDLTYPLADSLEGTYGEAKGHTIKNKVLNIDEDEPLISAETLKKFVKGMTSSEKLDGFKYFIDYQQDFIKEPTKLSVTAQETIRKIMKASNLVYAGGIKSEYYSTLVIGTGKDFDHIPPSAPVAAYVPAPVLTAPRSAWGKKMREKLDARKAMA